MGCDYDASGVVNHLNVILKQVAGIAAICLVVALGLVQGRAGFLHRRAHLFHSRYGRL